MGDSMTVYVRRALPYRRVESLSLLHLGRHVIFLNETGTKIWNLIDGLRSDAEVASFLAGEHSENLRDTIRQQALEFMHSLYRAGALRTTDLTPEQKPGLRPAILPDSGNPQMQQPGKRRSPAEPIRAICMTPKMEDTESTTVRDRLERLYWKNSYIQKMHLELTYRCNFRCVHCYNATHGGAESEMLTAQWRLALEQLANLGCHTVTFTG